MMELDKGQSIGVTKTSNLDALKNTVTTQLVENEWDIDPSRLLVVIGDNARHEMWLSSL